MKKCAALAVVMSLMCCRADSSGSEETESILQRLVDDYASDAQREAAIFAVTVGEDVWTIEATSAGATLSRGAPRIPTFSYKTDVKTLSAIAGGRMNGLTAMGQARSSDATPLTLEMLAGFRPGPEFRSIFLSTTSHFWSMGQPEVTRFGFDHARTIHGGEAVATYYEPGFRSAWYGILPGQHINADKRDQSNDFGSLFVIVKAGTARARIGGKEMELTDSTSIFVPAGMTHEFWNPGGKPAEMIMLAFGAGA